MWLHHGLCPILMRPRSQCLILSGYRLEIPPIHLTFTLAYPVVANRLGVSNFSGENTRLDTAVIVEPNSLFATLPGRYPWYLGMMWFLFAAGL